MTHAARPHLTDLGRAAAGEDPNIDVEEARERLREAQAALAGLGYQVSSEADAAHGFDGVWGVRTKQAVAQFQLENGLEGHGLLDEETFAAILDAHNDACTAESTSLTEDDGMALAADEVIHGGDHDSVSEQLGEPLDDEILN